MLSFVAGLSGLYDLVVGAFLLLAADSLASLFGVPAANPRIFSDLNVLFLLAVVHGSGQSPVTEIVSAAWAALNVSTEFIFGVCIGLVVRLSIAAAEVAGSLLAQPMGFSAAQAFDPTIGAMDTALTRLLRNLTLLLALIVGFHRVLLGTLLSSFHLLPVGTVTHLEATFPLVLELTAHVIGVGVRLALPVLALLLMANVALGFVARAAPTMQIFNVGFAVLFATGAVGLLLTLPGVSHEIARSFHQNGVYFERLLTELSPR